MAPVLTDDGVIDDRSFFPGIVVTLLPRPRVYYGVLNQLCGLFDMTNSSTQSIRHSFASKTPAIPTHRARRLTFNRNKPYATRRLSFYII